MSKGTLIAITQGLFADAQQEQSAAPPQQPSAPACPADPDRVVLARLQHLRQRGSVPPFLLDHTLCASARQRAFPGGPARVELTRFAYDGPVDLSVSLDRLKELEDPAFMLVGVGAVPIRQRDGAHVRVILAKSGRPAKALPRSRRTFELPALGAADSPESAGLMLHLLQERRRAVRLPVLVADPQLCAEATLRAAGAAGLVYEEVVVEACVSMEELDQLEGADVLEDPALTRIGVAVGPAEGGLLRMIAILGRDRLR